MISPFCKSPEGCMRDADSTGGGLCRFHADQDAGRRAAVIIRQDLIRKHERQIETLRAEIRALGGRP